MRLIPVMILAAALPLAVHAQSGDFNLQMHAHDHTTAAAIGLPQYPGSVLSKGDGDSSDSADLGFTLGVFNIAMRVATYRTPDDPQRVLNYYRKALAQYGDVLECDHGKAVGAMQHTKGGLTCSDDKTQGGKNGGSVQLNGSNSTDGHELRAGTPHRFRIASVEPKDGATSLSLVYLELPKDEGK
jgi:hypothetical protein